MKTILAILSLVGVAIGALKFGRGFLAQFFISPFQFFILVPWLIAAYAIKIGVMPMKSGPGVRRDRDPAYFRMNVRFCVLAGAAGFALNFFISWVVLSRSR